MERGRGIGALPVFTAASLLLTLAACAGRGDEAGSSGSAGRTPRVPTPTIRGPVTGGTHGYPETSAVLDLASSGYVEEEFLLSGTATSYEQKGTWDADGVWGVDASGSAPYTTRALVRRPLDEKKFNGTVVVEWLNVSSGVDVDVDFGYFGEEVVRNGAVWIGVSAQAAGVNTTSGSQFGVSAVGLKAWDPLRYGDLDHPGDAYSYDIFSQAGAAARAGGRFVGNLKVRAVLADGESQSAFRLLTYVNAVQPIANVFDGFLVHSRNGTGAPLGEGLSGGTPAPARVRTDLDAPVLQVLTETDMYGLSGNSPGLDFPSARQPDTASVHTWEVAGAAHADAPYLSVLLQQGRRQFGAGCAQRLISLHATGSTA